MDLSEFLNSFAETQPRSIPWYKKAEAICRTFSSETQNQAGVHHKVYLVLLKGVEKNKPGYAIYVGLTGLTAEERLERHKNGKQASAVVRKYGKCLLPSLYDHLNPMSYEEAVKLESDIFQALKRSGIPAFGGH